MTSLRPNELIQASQCFVYCVAKRRLLGECDAKCVDILALSKVKAVFLTYVADVGVPFVECCLHFNAT